MDALGHYHPFFRQDCTETHVMLILDCWLLCHLGCRADLLLVLPPPQRFSTENISKIPKENLAVDYYAHEWLQGQTILTNQERLTKPHFPMGSLGRCVTFIHQRASIRKSQPSVSLSFWEIAWPQSGSNLLKPSVSNTQSNHLLAPSQLWFRACPASSSLDSKSFVGQGKVVPCL